MLFDLRNRIRSAAAGGQHGVQHQNIALLNIRGQLAEILHGLQSSFVAVQADKANLSGGDQSQHTVQHTHTGAQNRHQCQLAASQNLGAGHGNGGFDLHFLGGQVTSGLVAQQHGDLVYQITEFLGAGGFVAQQADFVLDKGMVYDHGLFHNEHSLI